MLAGFDYWWVGLESVYFSSLVNIFDERGRWCDLAAGSGWLKTCAQYERDHGSDDE
jgi:hypothetical protein